MKLWHLAFGGWGVPLDSHEVKGQLEGSWESRNRGSFQGGKNIKSMGGSGLLMKKSL